MKNEVTTYVMVMPFFSSDFKKMNKIPFVSLSSLSMDRTDSPSSLSLSSVTSIPITVKSDEPIKDFFKKGGKFKQFKKAKDIVLSRLSSSSLLPPPARQASPPRQRQTWAVPCPFAWRKKTIRSPQAQNCINTSPCDLPRRRPRVEGGGDPSRQRRRPHGHGQLWAVGQEQGADVALGQAQVLKIK